VTRLLLSVVSSLILVVAANAGAKAGGGPGSALSIAIVQEGNARVWVKPCA
jgi:hypothetical protein